MVLDSARRVSGRACRGCDKRRSGSRIESDHGGLLIPSIVPVCPGIFKWVGIIQKRIPIAGWTSGLHIIEMEERKTK